MPIVGILIALAIIVMFPRLVAVFFVGPVAGVVVGSVLWGLGALIFPALNDFNVWLGFVIVTGIGATMFALSD